MKSPDSGHDDGLFPPPTELPIPAGVDRRSFLMRSGVIGAAAAMTGTTWTPEARAAQAAKEAALAASLDAKELAQLNTLLRKVLLEFER